MADAKTASHSSPAAYQLYKPLSAREKFVTPSISAILLALLVLAPVYPIFDFTGMFSSSNNYGRGNMGLVLVYALAVLGLNLLVGWAGQVGLAAAGLFGFGAYLTTQLFAIGTPLPVALVISGVLSAVIGVAVGFPAARLKGFFLAIATLAFGELIVKLIELEQVGGVWLKTGGGSGRSVPQATLFGLNPSVSAYYYSLIAFVIFMACMWILTRGRLGRTLKAVRDIEVVSGSLGISAVRYKLLAFGIASAVAAIAGGLFAQNTTYLSPHAFRTNLLFFMLVVLIVGGVGRIWGPFIGAIFFVALRELMQDNVELGNLIFGGALLVCILILPGGLASLPSRLADSKLIKDLIGRARGGAQ